MARSQSPKHRGRMPKLIWQIPRSILSSDEKHFLSFIWWCSPKGCHCWNCRLEDRFKISRRTVQRRLTKLQALGLIAIGHRDGPGRTIWPRYQAWRWLLPVKHHLYLPPETALGFPLPKGFWSFSRKKFFSQRVTTMTPVDNAQHPSNS